MDKVESLKQELEDGVIPLPDFWGGYRIVANEIEFWQCGANRLHDRFRYRRHEDNWLIDRLAP